MSDARRQLPEDLENVGPGPQLASLLASVDRDALSGKDRVRLLQARHRLVAHLQAELYADLHAISRDEPKPQPESDPLAGGDPPEPYPWASTEIAFALRWTYTAASVRLEQARQMIEDLPSVSAALHAGLIDVPKALLLCDEVAALPLEIARRIVDRLLAKAPELTTGQLRAKLRRLVIAADPTAAADRARAGAAGRRVVIAQEPANLASISACELLPHRVAASYERLTAIARAAKAAGDPRRIDELRADAMMDLLVGEGIATGGPITYGGLHPVPDTPTPPHHPPPRPTPPTSSRPVPATTPPLAKGRATSGEVGVGRRHHPVVDEGLVVGDGLIVADGQVVGDGLIVADGLVVRDGQGGQGRGVGSPSGTAAASTTPLACQPDADTPWPTAPADPDLLNPAADPPAAATNAPDANSRIGGNRGCADHRRPAPHPSTAPARRPTEPSQPSVESSQITTEPSQPSVESSQTTTEPSQTTTEPSQPSVGPAYPPNEGDPTVDPVQDKLHPYWLAGFDRLATTRSASCHRCGCQTSAPHSDQGVPARGPMPAPRRGTIDLHMSLTTLLGLDDLPAELAGYGPLLADIARQVVAQRPDLQLRFSVYNELDALLVHGTSTGIPPNPLEPHRRSPIRANSHPPGSAGRRTSRRPTAAVAALVRARNRTCVAPGCRIPSLRCELDHVLAWADHGETEPDNLDPACPRHHRFKHTPGTQLVPFTPGTYGWQTPLGMQYLSRPDPPIYDDHRYIHPPQPGDQL